MKAAPGAHAVVESRREERPIAIQPALGFQKGEEKQPGGIQQSTTARVLFVSGRARGEPSHLGFEDAVESPRQRVAAQDLDGSVVKRDIFVAMTRRESAERLGVGIDDAFGLPQE
jgi:hypothetical protein